MRRAKERFEKEEKHMVLRSESSISLTHTFTPSYISPHVVHPLTALPLYRAPDAVRRAGEWN